MTQNNLKDISARIPKHAMTVVTGVAGSGKAHLYTGLKNNTDAIIIDQNRCTLQVVLIY